MNVKMKIAGLTVITLIAGIAIGAIGQRVLIQQRVRGIFRMGAAGRIFPDPEPWLRPENEAQRKAVREVFAKQSERLTEIHKRFRKEIDASFDTLDKELDPILSPEQKKRLKDMRPKGPLFPGRPPMRGLFPGGPPWPGFFFDGLKKELGLSDDQAARIQAILDRYKEKAKPGFQEGPPGGGPGPIMEDMKKLDEEIEGILTETQKEIFRKLRQDRRRGPEGGFPPPGEGGPGNPPGPEGRGPGE